MSDETSRDKEVPLNLLFLKLPFLSKSATLTNLRRSEQDDLCVPRSQGKEVFSVLHPVEKITVSPAGVTSLLLDEDGQECVSVCVCS